jgi:hypothetical protein
LLLSPALVKGDGSSDDAGDEEDKKTTPPNADKLGFFARAGGALRHLLRLNPGEPKSGSVNDADEAGEGKKQQLRNAGGDLAAIDGGAIDVGETGSVDSLHTHASSMLLFLGPPLPFSHRQTRVHTVIRVIRVIRVYVDVSDTHSFPKVSVSLCCFRVMRVFIRVFR